MIVRVMFFAIAKEVVGEASIEMPLADEASVGDLKQTLSEQIPALSRILGNSAISVDQEYASDDRPLYHGAEVAVIPPVSGG